MRRRVLAAAVLLPALCLAQQTVSLHGTLGQKALLIIDGGPPRVMASGETHDGVRLLSCTGDQAMVSIGGQTIILRVGASPARLIGAEAPTRGDGPIRLIADAGGHFNVRGSINSRPAQFMIDTGASVVVLGQDDAGRLMLDYKSGEHAQLTTANGPVQGWLTKIKQLRLQTAAISDVDAVVVPAALPTILLDNNVLSHFNMQRQNNIMVLLAR